MKYYIALMIILSILVFGMSIYTLTETVKLEKEKTDRMVSQYHRVVMERDMAVSGLMEIQDRVNAVKEALR